ncbi:uncharacterized protein HLK63_J01463 [Nakaseomyces glabratus]|nr:uncharacterized protein GW608_J01463 [Nakaseomyces glabratus]UCS26809.1 uncharacterized protein HLK63_J01463 [Nakaseomyces glabratus]UCS32038.1 uncharacterized protein HLK64_J01463 [Nakaseomyces glabratus]UCS37267.1 uncharacterized protein HLK62_J01463 [Nakaseomyces glabratus]
MAMPGAVRKLQFSKPIISTLENTIAASELVGRLCNLHEELAQFVQDQVDLSSLDAVKGDLINHKLLKHKDLGVRAFTACCLSDILRLYAPEAPYTDGQLTDIFKLVLSQFEYLGDPDNGYYVQQTYLITRLLEYRSIVLITDLPTSDKLLFRLFEIFYDDNHSYQNKLFNVIGGLLGEVLSEFENMPLNVLKLIFNKFLTYNPEKAPKGLGVASNCGYEVSLILCENYTARMSRYLTKYYSEILYNITNEKNIDDSYEMRTKLIIATEKLHKLVYRLWETVPDLILSVIGFVYHELSSENEIIRKLATRLVGKMISKNTMANFVQAHEDTFKAWMTKIADIDADVRVEWISCIPNILEVRSDISDDIGHGLAKTLIDSDARVRKLSVTVFDEVPVKAIWENVKNISVYKSLLQLTREKNREIRELCIHSVGRFYAESRRNIEKESYDTEIWSIVESIPSTLFNLYYINDAHINQWVDEIVFDYLLPFENDDTKRVRELLSIVSKLDKKAFSSFIAFNKRQVPSAVAMAKFVEFCEVLKQSEYEDDLDTIQKYNKTIDWLSSSMADPIKTADVLETIKELNMGRVFFLIKNCVRADVTYSTFRNSYNELLDKLGDDNLFKKNRVKNSTSVSPQDIAHEIKALLLRSSPIIFNISNIGILLDNSVFENEAETSLKRKLVNEVSKISPTLFRDQLKNLKDTIIYLEDLNSRQEQALATEALKTIYKISKSVEDNNTFDDKLFSSKLIEFALNGSPQLAKYATKMIALSPDSERELRGLVLKILPLDIDKDQNFTSHLAILMEVFRFTPHLLDDESTNIVSYLIKNVLLSNYKIEEDKVEEGESLFEEHIAESNEHACLANKLFTLKLFTNKLRALSLHIDDDDLSKAFIEKTLKLYIYLIASGGELVSETSSSKPTPEAYQTILRLSAALQILKVARISSLNTFIKSTEICKLVNIVEDESLEVRRRFLDQLKDSLSCELISIKFLPLIFFTAYEPDKELKASTKIWINYTCAKPSFKKGTLFERVLPRLIHAIAHHPDVIEGFQGTEEEVIIALTTAVDYLVFYFDSVASQENFSLLYYLSERVKNYQDILDEDEESSANEDDSISRWKPFQYIYVVGELSQIILLTIKERRSWQHIAYPGKLNLPSDLFKPFDSAESAQATFKNYLSEKYAEKIKGNIVAKVGKLIHASQTQRQRSQKRLLDQEYREDTSPKKQRTKGSKTQRKDRQNDGSDIESDEEIYRGGNVEANASGVRKSNRARKQVDYNEDD